MREIKAFIRKKRTTEVIEALRAAGFTSLVVCSAEGIGKYAREGDMPSLRFPVIHSEMSKLEIVCKKEDVGKIVDIVHQHGSTGEKGDGFMYTLEVQRIFNVGTGQENPEAM